MDMTMLSADSRHIKSIFQGRIWYDPQNLTLETSANRAICREQMQSVLMSLEDELGALDLRYADLLRRAQLGLDGASLDSADDSEFEVSQSLLAWHAYCGAGQKDCSSCLESSQCKKISLVQ